MTTEEEARGLLAKAAASIDVDAAVPTALAELREPGPRRWPVLAAAAAVVVAVGGGVAIAQQVGGSDDIAPSNLPDRSTAVDQPTNQPSQPGDDGRLPSLIGYTDDEAIAVLEESGYPVQVRVVPDGCDVAGIVTGTSPPPGSPTQPGQPVTIRVVGEKTVIDCVGEVPMGIVWDVVRAARGLGEAPSLDGADFPEDVRDAVDAMVNGEPEGESQELVAVWGFDRHPCWAGGIDGIRFFMQGGRDDLVCPEVSTVVEFEGDSITSVRVEGATDEDITEEELEATLDRLASARRFVPWARGEGPAPVFADRVRVMFFGGPAFGHTGWAEDPESRSQYSGCSGLGFPDCGIDPVATVFHARGTVSVTAGRWACGSGDAVPRRFAEAEEDAVSLSTVVDGECAPLVELWIDEDGVIYGVNQAGASF